MEVPQSDENEFDFVLSAEEEEGPEDPKEWVSLQIVGGRVTGVTGTLVSLFSFFFFWWWLFLFLFLFFFSFPRPFFRCVLFFCRIPACLSVSAGLRYSLAATRRGTRRGCDRMRRGTRRRKHAHRITLRVCYALSGTGIPIPT